MDELQLRVARIALAACPELDYALGGGLAVAVLGLLDRPTEDVDLFCTQPAVARHAAAGITAALEAEGFRVVVDIVADDFARLLAEDDAGVVKLELVRDYRVHHPIRLDVGPVLHPDDAVANKVAALFGRWYPRDYLDVDAALNRYTRTQLLDLAVERDPGFDIARFRNALAELEHIPAAAFASYGLVADDVAGLRQRFAAWHVELGAQTTNPPPAWRPTTARQRPGPASTREPPGV